MLYCPVIRGTTRETCRNNLFGRAYMPSGALQGKKRERLSYLSALSRGSSSNTSDYWLSESPLSLLYRLLVPTLLSASPDCPYMDFCSPIFQSMKPYVTDPSGTRIFHQAGTCHVPPHTGMPSEAFEHFPVAVSIVEPVPYSGMLMRNSSWGYLGSFMLII